MDARAMVGGERLTVEVGVGQAIFVRVIGTGPPVLMLHGFPQTHLMWRDVAALLAGSRTVVCADLRGYGASSCPPSTDDHAPYSKRVMAAEMLAVMAQLGHRRFAVVGHDRGGRVAYRLALDHPHAVDRLAVMDVVPILDAWALADDRLALTFWPWSLLAQPPPLPERLVTSAPDAVIDNALGEWGSPTSSFDPAIRAAYVDALRDPEHVHAICEEYRAAATLDRDHDAADRSAGHQINCPTLVLWSGDGALATWYNDAGGPLGIWQRWATDIQGRPMPGGHFFPEEHPELTAAELLAFLTTQ